MIRIKKDLVACFRYIMRNEKDEVLENTMQGAATIYLHGGDSIHWQLQQQLEGLAAGDKKIVHLSKSSGLSENDFTFEVVIDEVRNALPEELFLGYPVQLVGERCGDNCDCYRHG